MTAATRILTTQVPRGLTDQVDVMAARLDRSQAWIVEQALAAWVDLEEERHRRTLEALEDVDAGRLIDHQTVTDWADSLSTDSPLPSPLP